MHHLLFISCMILYLLSVAIPSSALNLVVSILCLLIVALSFNRVGKTVQVISSIFLMVGLAMLWTSGAQWKDYILSFGPMLNLLCLFMVVPLLAYPIRLGNYASSIQEIISKKVKNPKQLYMMTSGLSYFFSSFINLASLPMTYHAIKPSLSNYSVANEYRFMSRAITHGFSMPLLWTPVTPIVGIVIEMNGVSWVSMLPYLVPLSLMGIGLDWLLATRQYNKNVKAGYVTDKETAAAAEFVPQQTNRTSRLFHILIALIIFNVIVSIIEVKSSFSFLFIVTLLVIPVALSWSILLRKGRLFLKGTKEHFQTHVVKMSGQFVIFLSAGFFISAMKFSNTDHVFNTGLLQVKDSIGVESFLVLLPLVPLILAFMGLHPAVAIALMAEALDPNALQISSQLLTLSMLGGAVGAFLMGPFNATIGLMATIVEESPYKISNWNAPFTISYLLLLMSFIFLLQLIA
ncbi:hypothetical protein ABE41_017645 [Fictibacillus arsenicus]|uniref:Citrate transporter-like domain-containing protein n=1 Tax=Fictibacillus arsenicus TaxID=255247 RepID=A0A1B1Z8R6_9BACL|nr:hypothetical protein [Fictibacillus arsenicus]ANX13838.1 hypothetical protein ABE41_017645 [Fictibacillus arsenicus]